MDSDPLSEPLPSVITPYDAERGRSFLGKAADGSDIYLTWENNAGILIAGMTGSGKTQSLLPVIAGMVGEAEVHIFDGKASNAWAGLRPISRTYDDSAEPANLYEFLGEMHTLAQARLKVLMEKTGRDEFWDVPVKQRRSIGMYPIIIVIEEAPEYVGTEVEDTKLSKQIAARSTRGMKLWRAAGIIQVVVTQKPTNDQIPSLIRANSSQKVCFRQDDIEAVKSMFGHEVSPSPKGDVSSGTPGRFVAVVGPRGPVLGQAPYVPRDQIAEHLKGLEPVPSQLVAAPTPAPGPFANVEVGGGGVTAPTVTVPQEVVGVPVVGVPAPGPVRPAPAPLDINSLTEEQRAALLTQLLSVPVPDAGGQARDTADPEPTPSAPTPTAETPAAPPPPPPDPDPEPPVQKPIRGFDF